MRRAAILVLALVVTALVACGGGERRDTADTGSGPADTFEPADCGAVTDADVTAAVGSTLFTRVVVSEAGCFWQENTAIGTFGIGMGISTWWDPGSDLDTERALELKGGRELV